MGHQAACSDSMAAAFQGVASIWARKEGPDRVTKCLVCRANKFRLCRVSKTPCSQSTGSFGTLPLLSNLF